MVEQIRTNWDLLIGTSKSAAQGQEVYKAAASTFWGVRCRNVLGGSIAATSLHFYIWAVGQLQYGTCVCRS